MTPGNDEADLRSAALKNARSILSARRRADEELVLARQSLEQKAEELRQQTEWLRVTLGSIGDAVIAVDTQRCVSFLNPAAETLSVALSGCVATPGKYEIPANGGLTLAALIARPLPMLRANPTGS